MRNILSFVVFLLLTVSIVLGATATAQALSSVLGAKVIGEEGIAINGQAVEAPHEVIEIDDSTPTFSGYTVPNVDITVTITSDPIVGHTLSDAAGYWSYAPDTPLDAGTHTLSLRITDQYHVTSDEVLAATFTVPEETRENPAAAPPDDVTPAAQVGRWQGRSLAVSLAILGVILLLSAAYVRLSHRPPLQRGA